MARLSLPTYDQRQVAPAQLPGVAAAAPRAQGGEIMGRQLQQASQQVDRAAGVVGQIGMDALERQNTLRVNDAMNKVRQAALDLEYGEQGFRRLKGENAMPDAFDGKPLTDAYLERYQTTVSEIETGLGNDAQRMAFRQAAGQLGAALRSQTQTYELEQANVYGRSVLTGGAQIAAQEAATAYDNPDRVRANIAQIGVLGNELFDVYDGLSANERQARVQGLQSSAVVDVVKAAADAGDLSLAGRYIEEFDAVLTAADRTKIDAVITPAREGQMARQIVENAFAGVSMANPGGKADFASSLETVFAEEGEGFVADDNGAGRSQLGITERSHPRAWADGRITREEAAAIYKRDYWDAIGADDLPAGLAQMAFDTAVNMGAGAARSMLAQAGGDVGRFADLRRQRYREIAENDPGSRRYLSAWLSRTDRLEAAAQGGSGPPPTSLREVIARAEAQLPPDASETLRQRTRQEATYQFNLRKEETDQEQAETFSMIYRKLAASGGDMSVLSPSELAAVPGDKLDSIISFADKLAKDNGADESDLGTYYRLSDPRTLRTMTDSAFVDALRDLNETDRRHFAAERAKLRGSTPARENDPNNLPSEIIGRTVTQFAQEIGLRTGGNGTDVQRIGTLRRAADQAVLARQARENRRLSDAEVLETVSSVFNAPGAVRGFLGGTSRETERAAEVTYNRIPNDIRRSLTDSLKRRFGGREPSETEVELEYLRRYSRAW